MMEATTDIAHLSPSSRRVWIEILLLSGLLHCIPVTLLAEGVDRNTVKNVPGAELGRVTLLAEGVDRNKSADYIPQKEWKSPSSRRVWIEIKWPCSSSNFAIVTLLAEGVDRNKSYTEEK